MLKKNSCGSRACRDILPTRANLHRRKIIEDPKYPICEQEEETTVHILLLCPSAMDDRSEGEKNFQKVFLQGPKFPPAG
jgi:hypothetical protein